MEKINNGSIIIVDDDPFVLKYVSLLLSEKGFIVTPHEKTGEALDSLKAHRTDVVLTDIKMPEISGIELIEKIHAIDPDTPVILMTAYADLDTAIAAIKRGAFDFIMKPFEPDYLIHSIEKAITYKRFLQMEKDYKKKIEDMNTEVLHLNRELENIVTERTISVLGLLVADRIRNPVTVIGGICHQLIKRGVDDFTNEKIKDILQECQKMEIIVSEFNTLVKERRSFFKREDLNEIILSTIKLIEQRIKDKNIELAMHLTEKPLLFNANKELVKIAIKHILDNTIDAALSRGRISISTETEDDTILLNITDTDRVMKQEELQNIFEPFYKTKEKAIMGFPLAKQIISEHLGNVVVKSTEMEGTTIMVSFPIRWKEKSV